MTTVSNYIKNNRLIAILNCCILSILLFPYSNVYSGGYSGNDPLTWKPQYVYEHIELIIPFAILCVFSIGFQIIRYSIWRKITLGTLVLISGIFSFHAFLSASLPIQDFTPSWGLLVTLFLFPLTLIIWKIDQRDYRIFKSKLLKSEENKRL